MRSDLGDVSQCQPQEERERERKRELGRERTELLMSQRILFIVKLILICLLSPLSEIQLHQSFLILKGLTSVFPLVININHSMILTILSFLIPASS